MARGLKYRHKRSCRTRHADEPQAGIRGKRAGVYAGEKWRRVCQMGTSFSLFKGTWIFPRSGERRFHSRNIFYRLAMKAKNEAAEAFQAKIADEVIPSIRKHGAYMTPETLEKVLCSPDTIIQIATALKQEQEKSRALEAANSALAVQNQIMAPKADYFDELVDRNLLTNFRETAKQLEVPPKKFVAFLLEHKYIYRDKKGKLLPYEAKNNGLFEVKETFNEKTQWSGTQTMVTPKGRETFRLLYMKSA